MPTKENGIEPENNLEPSPNPNTIYPVKNTERIVFLKNIVKNPQIIVGDYTYYDDPEDVSHFEKNVSYLFDFIGDQLIIGKFCQIATGVRFIMNGGNHAIDGQLILSKFLVAYGGKKPL